MQTKLNFRHARRPATSKRVGKSTLAETLACDTFDPYWILEAADWNQLLDEAPLPCVGAFSAREDMLLLDAV